MRLPFNTSSHLFLASAFFVCGFIPTFNIIFFEIALRFYTNDLLNEVAPTLLEWPATVETNGLALQ